MQKSPFSSLAVAVAIAILIESTHNANTQDSILTLKCAPYFWAKEIKEQGFRAWKWVDSEYLVSVERKTDLHLYTERNHIQTTAVFNKLVSEFMQYLHLYVRLSQKTDPGNVFLLKVVLIAQLGVLIGNEISRSSCQNRFHILCNMNVFAHELHADYPISEHRYT